MGSTLGSGHRSGHRSVVLQELLMGIAHGDLLSTRDQRHQTGGPSQPPLNPRRFNTARARVPHEALHLTDYLGAGALVRRVQAR
jgi:hypothetical protein